jgi:hypothetical protein
VRLLEAQAIRLGVRRMILVSVGDSAGFWHRMGFEDARPPTSGDALAGYGPTARVMLASLPRIG